MGGDSVVEVRYGKGGGRSRTKLGSYSRKGRKPFSRLGSLNDREMSRRVEQPKNLNFFLES